MCLDGRARLRNLVRRPIILGLAVVLSILTAACDFNPGAVTHIVDAPEAREVVLRTSSGPVVGVASAAGQAFLGIPYAAPPVGPLRWRAPQPPVPWAEPRPARALGETCLQTLGLDAQTGNAASGPFLGAEDCLTLNVYAPPEAKAGDRRPVMVWIYGGAFVLGAGGQYDPSRLAARSGHILVTFNYRLGVLGFLAHPALRAEAGEGAFALLDQQAALRWVRDNIGALGGDAGNVTLFGQSAGAWSVCAQMASPTAAGLFHRAILESGACLTPETSLFIEEAEAGGEHMGTDLGCDGAEALTCLRAKPADDLLSAAPARRGVVGPNSWAPAYGRDVLPVSPRVAFSTGRFNRVPMIDGTNRDEGLLFTYLRGYRGEIWTAGNYETAVRSLFGPPAAAILGQYPSAAFGSPGRAYAAVLTDALFACASVTLDRLAARHVPVYAYEFDDPDAPFNLPAMPWLSALGSFHTAEIAYVFGTPWILADPARFDDRQRALADVIQEAWIAFARRGDPNPVGGRRWARVGPAATRLTLGRTITQTDDFSARHRCAFWSTLGY